MRKHTGMRPQDVVILLKIISAGKNLLNKDLAVHLFISPAEVSDSLNRSVEARLLNSDKRTINKLSLLEFIEFGLPYVFPAVPGATVNGMLTAHSHPAIKPAFMSDVDYVWPSPRGLHRGYAVEPLYKDVPKACEADERLYKILALVEMVRVGRIRETKYAVQELKLQFQNGG